jgi:imidazole glycerol-phosphate synthase subunit HisF
MYRNRIIPCLLLKKKGLVKTVKFDNPNYIGDPLNAVKIFNDKGADELFFIDIDASKEGKIQYEILKRIANQSFMPLGYAGGIKSIEDASKIFSLGFEKVCLNTVLFSKKNLISEISEKYGSQSTIVCIDVKKDIFGKYNVYNHLTKKKEGQVIPFAKKCEELGCGEIIIQSVDNDGLMNGYDYKLIKKVSESVNIPIVSLGGCGALVDITKAVKNGASACGVGSLFIYYGSHKAVLINYPSEVDI